MSQEPVDGSTEDKSQGQPWGRCPRCASEDKHEIERDWDGGSFWIACTCRGCEFAWTVEYDYAAWVKDE